MLTEKGGKQSNMFYTWDIKTHNRGKQIPKGRGTEQLVYRIQQPGTGFGRLEKKVGERGEWGIDGKQGLCW